MTRFYSHYEKILLFLEHEISKSMETLRRKTSKSEIFPAHPPLPCIRQQHAVNLKLYRSHKRTELWFLKSGLKPRLLCFMSTATQPLCPLTRCSNTSKTVPRGECVHVHVCTSENSTLPSCSEVTQ